MFLFFDVRNIHHIYKNLYDYSIGTGSEVRSGSSSFDLKTLSWLLNMFRTGLTTQKPSLHSQRAHKKHVFEIHHICPLCSLVGLSLILKKLSHTGKRKRRQAFLIIITNKVVQCGFPSTECACQIVGCGCRWQTHRDSGSKSNPF